MLETMEARLCKKPRAAQQSSGGMMPAAGRVADGAPWGKGIEERPKE